MGAKELFGGAAQLLQAHAPAAAHAAGAAWSLSAGSWPEWLQLGLAILGVGAAFGLIGAVVALKNRFPVPAKHRAADFVRMLCAQLWEHSDHIAKVFAERLRNPPSDIAAMRILVRLLREDLSTAINFIEQMRAHPPGSWHGADIFTAFTNWSAPVVAMAKQLDDLHQAVTYPLLREPVDKQRDATLVYQYLTEQAFLLRRVDDVEARAYAFCAVARKLLDKDKKPDHGHGEGEAHECPCCKRTPGDHHPRARDPLQPIVLPPPPAPPPPPPSPPPPPVCRCTAVQACICMRGCACACQCPPAPPPKPAS